MNRRQKALLRESAAIVVITLVAMIAIVNLKDWLNRREAMFAMEELGTRLLDYRSQQGSLPPEDYVDSVLETIAGRARLDPRLTYRAHWIGLDADSETILAYAEKHFSAWFVADGTVVLRLDGRVEWMPQSLFTPLLDKQQTPEEKAAQGNHTAVIGR
ncbi:hypothetical protein ACFL6U_13535 [Planctomycetota bacterium]